jgi:NlpC/P60 family
MAGDEARLIERLLADPGLRRRFEDDPVGVAREAGLDDLADELDRADDHDGRRLDPRESRSSAAGVFVASVLEGLGFLDLGGTGAAHFDGAQHPGVVPDQPPAAHAPVLQTPPAPPPPPPLGGGGAAPVDAAQHAGAAPAPAPTPAADVQELPPTPAGSPPPEPAAVAVSAPATTFPAVTPAQVDADKAASLAARAQAALSPNPDDWDGNLDDEDAGSDEVDGSNEDEPDEAGGEDDDSPSGDSAADAGDDGDDGEDGGGDDSDGGGDEPDENENEGEDEPGEGSNGEDAHDDESDGDSSDGSPDSSDGSDSSGSGSNSGADDSSSDASPPDHELSLDGAPGDYPGDNAPPEDVAAWMGKHAEERGLPPELPVMAALTESGLKNLDHGDADSVGLFQMRLSIWDHGDLRGYPNNPDLQLKWFLDHAEAVERQRVERGLPVDDPKQYGEWIADVERPAEQYRGRYQLRLDDARALLEKAGAKHGGDTADPPDDGGDGGHGAGDAAPPPEVGDVDGAGAAANPRALGALSAAEGKLGTPYRWGGSSPTAGFDCSGLVQWAYAQVGVSLPRVTYDQIDVGRPVDRAHLLAGDVVFFHDARGDIAHCGISLGGNKFIHAPHTGDVVKISSLSEPGYASEFAGGRRIAPAVDGGAGNPDLPDQPQPRAGHPGARPHGGADPQSVRAARRDLGRDAAEVRRPGSRLAVALERQEQGKAPRVAAPHGFLAPDEEPGGAHRPDDPPDRRSWGPSPSDAPAPADLPANPSADAAARHLAEYHYGFVRESSSTPDYAQLKAAGYNGVLFHANDAHLGEAIAAARAAGIQSVGIWAPANGEDPATFAHRLAELEKYKPSIVVPDVEIEGKGLPGSPQWQWSEQFANLYRRLVPNQTWAVTVTPYQDDFNYGAYTSRDAQVWPQTYGATYDTTFDPQSVVDRVAKNGVDPRLINPVLAPNQSGDGLGHYASYALDDFGGKLPPFSPPSGGAPSP